MFTGAFDKTNISKCHLGAMRGNDAIVMTHSGPSSTMHAHARELGHFCRHGFIILSVRLLCADSFHEGLSQLHALSRLGHGRLRSAIQPGMRPHTPTHALRRCLLQAARRAHASPCMRARDAVHVRESVRARRRRRKGAGGTKQKRMATHDLRRSASHSRAFCLRERGLRSFSDTDPPTVHVCEIAVVQFVRVASACICVNACSGCSHARS